MAVEILPFGSEQQFQSVAQLWNSLLPGYQVPAAHLRSLLQDKRGSHYVACSCTCKTLTARVCTSNCPVIGFVGTYVDESTFDQDEQKGHIAVSLVDAGFQNKGVGTQLLNHACDTLLRTHGCNTIVLGSVFPRFWPGVPTDIPSKDQAFFKKTLQRHALLQLSDACPCRDLYIELDDYTVPAAVMRRVAEAGINFTPLDVKDAEQCIRKQRQNFKNDGWVAAYEELVSKGHSQQIMVAYNSDRQQVGWTLMVEADLPVWDTLAFPHLLGHKTGLIACVGVDADARGAGIGLALVGSALKDLQRRGARHVFVDWVVLHGWYEKLGFMTWREYQTLTWRVVDAAT